MVPDLFEDFIFLKDGIGGDVSDLRFVLVL